MTMMPLAYKTGSMLNGYERLSRISVTDIEKAIKYAVTDQAVRKDFYRDYISANDIRAENHENRIKSMEDWSRDFKTDFRTMKTAVTDMQKTQAVNSRILASMERLLRSHIHQTAGD